MKKRGQISAKFIFEHGKLVFEVLGMLLIVGFGVTLYSSSRPAQTQTMEDFNRIIGEVRQHRSKNKMPQNAELTKAKLTLENPLNEELLGELKAIAKIKEIKQDKGEFKIEIS